MNGIKAEYISTVDSHDLDLSYTLRVPNLQTKYTIKQPKTLLISKVKCIGKFDQGSIPELDSLLEVKDQAYNNFKENFFITHFILSKDGRT